MIELDKIKDLKNWIEVPGLGIYRYVIAAKVAYEIYVEFWYSDTPIETAKAKLCIVGLWNNRDVSNSLEREWLADNKSLPIQDLLEVAAKDYKENN